MVQLRWILLRKERNYWICKRLKKGICKKKIKEKKNRRKNKLKRQQK